MGPDELVASTSTPKTRAVCGACGLTSDGNAKFCAGCGQSLFEACGDCGKPVLLTQKFCGSCGCNLEQKLQQRLDEVQTWLAGAVKAAKEHRYDHAILLLKRAANPQDYRFSDLAAHASTAVHKVQNLRDGAVASADSLTKKAKDAFENDQKADAARCVQQIPELLRSDEAKRILASSMSFLGQASTLVNDLQASIRDKNWLLAGSLLGQAIELSPDEPQYRKLGTQVSEKLYKLAEKYCHECNYSRAPQCLDAIPVNCQSKKHEPRRTKIERIVWFSQQFDREAFATATLGRLAVRFSKEAPHDEAAVALVKQLAAEVKKQAETPRDPWAPWQGDRSSWCGGPAGFLAYPQSVQFAGDSLLRKVPGRFNVALGLAFQGLGLGRVQESFLETKGLLAGFGRRKKRTAWGIDIGSSTISAVLLNRDEEGELTVEQDYYVVFDAPLCRPGQEAERDDIIRTAVETMLEEVDLGDAPVWVNLPAGELVTRFVRLPPLGDKQAKAMLKTEAEQRIPLDIEELRLVQWIAELGDDDVTGRPASISAARKSVVEERLQLCDQAGLKVTGMQADSLALVNFADREFSELWSAPEEHRDQEEDDAEHDQQFCALDSEVNTVLMLDAGAETTTLVIVSSEAFWFWNAESGGEALTSAIASSSKLLSSEAEEKKYNPASLDDPCQQWKTVEKRQEELRGRLETMVGEAKKQNKRFKIVQSWCFGGSCLAHGWIRRVLLGRKT